MRQWVLLTLSILLAGAVRAASGEGGTPAPPATPTARAGNATAPGLWGLVHQPAGLAGLAGPAFGLSAERPWALPGMDRYGIAAALPLGRAVLGAGGSRMGDAAWREHTLTLAVAMPLGPRLLAGWSAGLWRGSSAGYGHALAWRTSLGLQADPGGGVRLAAVLRDPHWPGRTRASGGWGGEAEADRFAPSLTLAASAAIGATVGLHAETTAAMSGPVAWRLGLDHQPHPRWHWRAGVEGGPAGGYAGGGWQTGWGRLDWSLRFHPLLGTGGGFGWTTQLGDSGKGGAR
jgi:hypothetical protein